MSAPAPIEQRPRRLSLSQILELMLTRGGGDRSAVTIARHVGGAYSWDVKVRTGDDGDIQTPADAYAKAREIAAMLEADYPPPADPDDADVNLTRNAKGDVQIGVGVKTAPGELSRIGKAAERAFKTFDGLALRYPFGRQGEGTK